MWHYPTAGQKKSKGAVFQKEREVPRETGGSERSRRFQRQGFPRGCFGGVSGVFQRKCLEGDALGCFGGASGVLQRKCLEGDALGCFGDVLEN